MSDTKLAAKRARAAYSISVRWRGKDHPESVQKLHEANRLQGLQKLHEASDYFKYLNEDDVNQWLTELEMQTV